MEGYEEALTQVQNKQSLLENFHRLEHQLETLKERLVPHHRERADLEVEIHHLEQDGTYQEKVQALANKETQVRDMVALWGRKRIAMELIYATLRHGLDNPLPEMNRLADELFETLSYGRYTQIKLQKTASRCVSSLTSTLNRMNYPKGPWNNSMWPCGLPSLRMFGPWLRCQS